jgi:hypothetical protein
VLELLIKPLTNRGADARANGNLDIMSWRSVNAVRRIMSKHPIERAEVSE